MKDLLIVSLSVVALILAVGAGWSSQECLKYVLKPERSNEDSEKARALCFLAVCLGIIAVIIAVLALTS